MIDVPAVQALAEDAAKAILEVYQTEFAVYTKTDSSPVTEADLRSHQIITQGLAELNLGPVVSEEGLYTQQDVDYWLVDPLDGTKDFLNRTGGFAINIAYVRQGKPVFGMILAPISGDCAWALRGQGAVLNGQPCQLVTRSKVFRAAESVFHAAEESKAFYEENGITDIHRIGSSLKFISYLKGEIDVYLRLRPTCEWDTAAGQVLVEESGGRILDLNTLESLRYNKPSPLNPSFLLAPEGANLLLSEKKIAF